MQSVSLTERISVIDSLRGLALLGILMMNIPYFSGPAMYAFDLSIRHEFSGPSYWCWWVVYGLFEGTMRGAFSMLFGAGTLLLLTRLQAKNPGLYPADIVYRRMIILILFGLFNAFILNWAGDILFNYGVCGLFIFPFRNLRPLGLVMMGTACLIVASLASTFTGRELVQNRIEGTHAMALEKTGAKLTKEQEEAKKDWQKYLEKRTPESRQERMTKHIGQMRGDYFTVQSELAGWNVKFETVKLYKEYFWDAIGCFFIGMALFKWGVLTGQRSTRFYLIMAIVCLAIGLPINYYMLKLNLEYNFDNSLILEKFPVNLYQLKRLMMTLGHIGVFMIFYKLGWFAIVYKWLSKVGQMAFSNYLGQSIIGSLIFYGYGFGLFGALARYQTYEVVAAIWVFQIIFSNIWLHYFRFGPFEWVWRSLTYWKRQPMLKVNSEQRLVNN